MASRVALVTWVGLLTLRLGQCWAQPVSSDLFRFREPRLMEYQVSNPAVGGVRVQSVSRTQWLTARPANGSTNTVEFGSRIVLQLRAADDLSSVLEGSPVQVARQLGDGLFVLQAADAWAAVREADRLARNERVVASYPVTRRPKRLFEPYAPRPNDPFFYRADQPLDQWQPHLENRDTNGTPQGIDLNVRAAWPVSRGEGVLVAIADEGVELSHPDLIDRTRGAPHFNFVTMEPDGSPSGSGSFHGTAVAGLAAATADNGQGIAGVAPLARLASWVVFDANETVVSDEALMDMFQSQSNVVQVQNHSWGKVGPEQVRLSLLEDRAISNAVQFGRSGRGVVLVRAGGNGRLEGDDANDDGYLADPRVIAVAAARLDGRVAGYSAPGACLLTAGLGGDSDPTYHPCLPDSPNLTTTDLTGSNGYNRDPSGNGDYAYGTFGFSGTSAATPQISGVVALILAANPNLTYRDVQQILVHSGRFAEFTDPTLATNAAGFRVSHNLGFGVPDAGLAVRLARLWVNRPPATNVTYTSTHRATIPDLGLRVAVQGTDVPANLRAIVALPGSGPHPNAATTFVPLVDVGGAWTTLTNDLRGQAALIQRGSNYFCEKLTFAAEAGAELAIVYNNTDVNKRIAMGGTDLTVIPSVFISQIDGEALRDYLAAMPGAQVRLELRTTNYTFNVTETLQCEFVGVRLDSTHTARGDLRIVLTSPGGTHSILQRANQDSAPGPNDWTYYSVQHFYESSFGTWTLTVLDEDNQGTGAITSVSLIIHGVPITDADHDGLDDNWEMRHFNSLAAAPTDDPDQDGFNNAREQVLGTDPNAIDAPLQLDLSRWDSRLARLSWPGTTNITYRVEAGPESAAPLTVTTNVPGQFPETEWFVPYTNLVHQFFQLQAVPNGH